VLAILVDNCSKQLEYVCSEVSISQRKSEKQQHQQARRKK
jgi:hypothetical protein